MCRTSSPSRWPRARTRSVGVLVPTIANSIFADTVQGLSDELEPLGYAVILAQSRYDAAREDHMLSALLSRRPEAIIMVGSPATEDGARLLRRAGIPVAETWDLPATPIDAVAGFDNYEAGVAVARHLVDAGPQAASRSSAATIRAPHGAGMDSTTRAQALGAKAPRRLMLDRNASGSVAALAELPGVDAVFAANDAHAIGFMSGLRKAGLLRDGPAAEQPVARHRPRRSRNGPADRAKPFHHPRARRCDRAHGCKVDAGAGRAASRRSRI